MNQYERIKAMSIEEMAKELVMLQLNVMTQIQQNLVYCLPLPDENQMEKMQQDTIKALESEVEE
jgi:hypothetical protein